MDKALTREESQALMGLLGLDMIEYGNMPVMRKAFLSKCKLYHPDKGGDGEDMKKLIYLYRKLESKVEHAEDEFTAWTSEEVCAGIGVDPIYIKDWHLCIINASGHHCPCLMCRLRRNHQQNKGNVLWPPNVWMRCYCFTCFTTWFGLPQNPCTAYLWTNIIGETPLKDLNL